MTRRLLLCPVGSDCGQLIVCRPAGASGRALEGLAIAVPGGKGPGPVFQARTQVPSRRVRPCRSRVRRLIAAHRLCSQALFLAVPV